MASDSKQHKKKYRVRKGRVAAAAGILAAVVAAIAGVCVFFGNKGNNDKRGAGAPEKTLNPDDISKSGEYVKIDLEDCNLYVGNILRLKCSSNPAEYAGSVIWSSSDENIVSVNGKGDIIVRAEGSAAITATHGLLSDSVIIKAVSRESHNYDDQLPVYDIDSNGEIVVVQTAASGDNSGHEHNTQQGGAQETETAAPWSGDRETQGALPQPSEAHTAELPTASAPQGGGETAVTPTEEETEAEPPQLIVAGITEAGFTRYFGDTYIYVEDSNYLGQIIVGDSFAQIYVMTRTTSFDAALKRVIMSLLPTEYENVFAQLVSAEADRTFGADGYRVRIVAPTGGGHAQLIIYY
ncbi:MAG: Ig-like domain-containing protein [Butyrivibrio sp.]|nr:Ig-like domain-containing protein [Butyrivibrio sp.]